MTFASSAFQNSGFQTDSSVVTTPVPAGRGSTGVGKRRYYEILGKLYLLSEDELEYLLNKLLTETQRPRKETSKAIRIHAPKEWEPPAADEINWDVWDELVADVGVKGYAPAINFLKRYSEDEDVSILLLYG